MNRSVELFEEIESYIKGELSLEAKKAFEKRMAENIELSREVALHKSVQYELGDTKELRFRDLLNRIREEQEVSSKKRNFPWRIAASIALLLGVSFYFYIQVQNSESNLYEDYYKPYPVEDRLRGAELTVKDSALQLYKAGEYQKASDAFKPFLELDSKDFQLQLYYGNCLLNLNQEDKAILLFKSIPQESSTYENAQWFLALAQLKKGDIDTAIAHLQRLVDYNGIHRDQAHELLQKLRD